MHEHRKDLFIVKTKKGWRIVKNVKGLKKKELPGAENMPCMCQFNKKDQKVIKGLGLESGGALFNTLMKTGDKLIKTGKEKIEQSKKFIKNVIHGRHDAYPPNAKKVLDANGEAQVKQIELHRMVLPEIYNGIMNVWTKGEIAKRLKNQPKDKLFHISMWVKLSNGKTVRIEKNAVINLEENPSKPKEEETQEVNTPNVSLNELLEKTRSQVGDKDFFSYSAKDNNCGNFIEFILKANGVSSPETHDFIGQNTQEILDGFPSLRKTLNTVTDLAGKADVVIQGGALSSKDLKDLLGASYNAKDTVNDFQLDKEISSKTSQVYHNPKTGQVVVAHRGTKGTLDWGNNLAYAVGGKKAYKMTPRFKEAEKVQKNAEQKYGAKNVTTIGHSQGGLQAELLGGNSKEIITLNKATNPFENKKQENQYDIRTSGDIVSALNPFQSTNKKEIVIQSKTGNPLTEHSLETLEGLDQSVGQGFKRQRPKKKSHDTIMIGRTVHPAMVSDRFPRTPQSFNQVHGRKQCEMGSGLYASGSGMSGGRFSVTLAPEADYFSKRFEYMGKGFKGDFTKGVEYMGSGFKGDFTKGVEYMGSGFPFKEVKYGTRPVVEPRPAVVRPRPVRPRPAVNDSDSESDEEMRPIPRGGRLKKGSAEAKAHMSRIRKMKGGRVPAPPSRSYVTDSSLLG